MAFLKHKPYLPEGTRRTAMTAKSLAVITGTSCVLDVPPLPASLGYPGQFITPGSFYGPMYDGTWLRDSSWGVEGDLANIPLGALKNSCRMALDLGGVTHESGGIEQADAVCFASPSEDEYEGGLIWEYGVYAVVPSCLDSNYYISVLVWHLAEKFGWNAEWDTFWATYKDRLDTLFSFHPLDGGLVLNNGHDNWGQPRLAGVYTDTMNFWGKPVAPSLIAYAAANALVDMHTHGGDPAKAVYYSGKANEIKAGIRAAVMPNGWLPHTVGCAEYGGYTNTMVSPEATAHAVAYNILTPEQAIKASEDFCALYLQDKALATQNQNATFELFMMKTGFRGAIRQALYSQDYGQQPAHPGYNVFPGQESNINTYKTYQNGGYWYWRTGDVAYTMQLTQPELAAEFLNATIDDGLADGNAFHETVDLFGWGEFVHWGGRNPDVGVGYAPNYLGSTTPMVGTAEIEPYVGWFSFDLAEAFLPSPALEATGDGGSDSGGGGSVVEAEQASGWAESASGGGASVEAQNESWLDFTLALDFLPTPTNELYARPLHGSTSVRRHSGATSVATRISGSTDCY